MVAETQPGRTRKYGPTPKPKEQLKIRRIVTLAPDLELWLKSQFPGHGEASRFIEGLIRQQKETTNMTQAPTATWSKITTHYTERPVIGMGDYLCETFGLTPERIEAGSTQVEYGQATRNKRFQQLRDALAEDEAEIVNFTKTNERGSVEKSIYAAIGAGAKTFALQVCTYSAE